MSGSNCGGNMPIDGGTFRDSTFERPSIYDGKIYNSKASGLEVSSGSLVNGINIDGMTAVMLAEQLCEHIQKCLTFPDPDMNAIAAVFSRCDGTKHLVGNTIPTCGEMNEALSKFKLELENMLCELKAAIDADRITGFTWNDDKDILTIHVQYLDGTTNEWTVPFTQFLKKVLIDGKPTGTTESDVIPNTIFGDRSALMGAPVKWKAWGDGTVSPAYPEAYVTP